jgi:hypothetical protein
MTHILDLNILAGFGTIQRRISDEEGSIIVVEATL